MCKIFYKKLHINNKFTDNFLAQAKKYIKGKKKDNIPDMIQRLNICLQKSRQTVEDAQNMGGLLYNFKTRLTLREQAETPPNEYVPQSKYKSMFSRSQDYEHNGLSRSANTCHTCGEVGHNRYTCTLFMNQHCNNTHTTWSQSPEAADFRRIGHSHFVPNIYLNGEVTKVTTNNGASACIYPTEGDITDNGPDESTQNNNKNKNKHNNNNNNNKAESDRNNNDRDNDRNSNCNTDRNNDRDTDRTANRNRGNVNNKTGQEFGYRGKSKLSLTDTQKLQPDESQEFPTLKQLLSAILHENIDDYL